MQATFSLSIDPLGRWLLTGGTQDLMAWNLPLDPLFSELPHDELLAAALDERTAGNAVALRYPVRQLLDADVETAQRGRYADRREVRVPRRRVGAPVIHSGRNGHARGHLVVQQSADSAP